MGDPEFYPVTVQDLGALRDIYAHYVKTSTATFHMQEPSLDLMSALLIPSSPRYYSCLARLDGDIVGYGILGRYKPREAYDQSAEITVYLKEGMTGRGLGKAFVRHLEGIAKERGFHALLAGICGENLASIGLFQSMGFEKCAHYHEVGQKFGRWLDVVFFEKLLPSAGE
jgi:phosphinothricin acetyltransferase